MIKTDTLAAVNIPQALGSVNYSFPDNYIGTSNPAASSSDSSSPDTDDYVYDFNLVSTPNLTVTGDFEARASNEHDYSHTYSATAGTFTIDQTTGQFTYDITLTDAVNAGLTTTTFTVSGFDGPTGDTDTITFHFILCFAAGTRIATPDGERLVQELGIGDMVMTADGRDVPVRWIGRTTISPMFTPADRLEPVLIRAGALGKGVPNRDLIVTADHGMVIDGLVINAGALVGARGIEWFPWKALGASLVYYHVETEDHDVILANGAEAETFVDYVGRKVFDNWQEYLDLYGPERTIPEMDRPRISAQRLVPDAIRKRLGIPDEEAFDFGMDAERLFAS